MTGAVGGADKTDKADIEGCIVHQPVMCQPIAIESPATKVVCVLVGVTCTASSTAISHCGRHF